MGFLLFFGFFAVIIIMIVRAAVTGGPQGQRVRALDSVATNGIPARGLVLACSPYVIGVTLNGRRFERRSMTIDVEIPGRQAYVISGDYLVPRGLVEAIPGSSLELAVDPSNAQQIAVLGPGGFSGPWLRLGPPQPY